MTGLNQRFDLGVHYFARREYDAAALAFRDVVREDPAHSAAWSRFGMSLAHLGRAMEAEAALSRAVALSPLDPEVWFHLGVARGLREEWPAAVSAYRHAVALDPGDLVAWHRLGVALAESGEETAAEAAFERALVLSRELPDEESGEAGPEAPDHEAVDDHVRESGEREGSREAKSWLDLALKLLSLGDEEEAVAAYERAYTLDPERAQHSLFRPMLRLLTAVAGASEPADVPPVPEPPAPAEEGPPAPPGRPEVS